jgi:hypothetical protein
VLLRLEGEGVDVNTGSSGNVLVVLVRLDVGEVGTSTFSKAVVTIELKLSISNINISSEVRTRAPG